MIAMAVGEFLPVQYLPSGDKALLVAWTIIPPMFFIGGQITRETAEKARDMLRAETEPRVVLCLEDGSAVIARLDEFKFDYRYDNASQRFVDMSRAGGPEEDGDADADQEAPDHGGEGVSGLVPDADGTSPGDPG